MPEIKPAPKGDPEKVRIVTQEVMAKARTFDVAQYEAAMDSPDAELLLDAGELEDFDEEDEP